MKKGARKFCSMVVSLWVGISLCFTTFAQELRLPAPTQRVSLSPAQSHPVLRGVKINPDNPLQIEFVIDKQQEKSVTKEDIKRLVSYFMAALTIPETELWVNLSPYEQDRIIPNELGQTAFGEGLLAQDYFLKQLASSLTYPESASGKNYWQMVLSGQTQKPVNAFNKIWIVPQAAEIYENGNTALITQAKLKVLTEEDYLAMQKSTSKANSSTNALKQLIIPQIEKEINSGENFSELRQIFCSYMLAKWFKNKLKDSFYKYYIDQKKIKGIDLTDKTVKEKVYNQYVEAFKKGVYNYIKADRTTQTAGWKITKRQYFSGGIVIGTPVNISHDSGLAAQKMVEGPFSGSNADTFANSQGTPVTGGRFRGPTRLNTLLVGGALLGAMTQINCDTGLRAASPFDGGPVGDGSALVSEAGKSSDGGVSSSTDAAASFPDAAIAAGSPDAAGAVGTSDTADSDTTTVAPKDAAAAAGIDAPNVSPDSAFRLPPTFVLAGNDYLKNASALVVYANKNFKSGVGYPKEGLIKLANALMNASQTAAYGTALTDQIRAILDEDSQAALVITGQFDPLYLAALAIELGKQPADLLNSLYSVINQLAAWKSDPVASAGYVPDPGKEKVLYILALQYGTTISDLFKRFPKLASDADYPFILRIALQVLKDKPAAGDSILNDLTTEYQNALAQLGAQATRADLEALVLSWHKLPAVNLVAMRPSFATFAADENTIFVYNLPDSFLSTLDLSSDLAVALAGPRYVATDGGTADVGHTDMTKIDTAQERAKIARRPDVIKAKEGWVDAIKSGRLPVQAETVSIIDANAKPIDGHVLTAYVDEMPKDLRATVVDYRDASQVARRAIILPSEQALRKSLGENAQAILDAAGVTAAAVIADRRDHEAGEIYYFNHSVAWFAQIFKYGGELTPEQKLQLEEQKGDGTWQIRMREEVLAGRAGHEGDIMEIFGDNAQTRTLIAKNRGLFHRSLGGVDLKTEIKTRGNGKAITLKLSPKIVEQVKKNGLRINIVRFGYGVNLQDMLNGR